MTDITKFNSALENKFSLLLEQCSPLMKESLSGENYYKIIKENPIPLP